MGNSVGIDLGTSQSAIAYVPAGSKTAEIIANAEGGRTTPSIVAFVKNSNEILVGETAKRQAVTNAERTIIEVKRHMGEKWTVDIDGKKWTPEEISSRILMKLKKDAEAFLGGPVTDAVITVPAYFDNAQREATKQAGEIAGLNVLRIINEPTAAALAYGLDKGKDGETILIEDAGGGTDDVSLLTIGKDEDGSVIEVLATGGNNHLGGSDFDQKIINWLIAGFKARTGVDLTGDKIALQRLKEAAENAKKELSSQSSVNISLPYLSLSKEGPLNMDETLTRAKFDELTADLIEKIKQPIVDVLKDSKVNIADINNVILVGGSTRIPAIYNVVKEVTGKTPSNSVQVDEIVAIGAAIQANSIKNGGSDVLLLDVLPL